MNADETTELFATAQESALPLSALCVSTSLHEAIASQNMEMLGALLTKGSLQILVL